MRDGNNWSFVRVGCQLSILSVISLNVTFSYASVLPVATWKTGYSDNATLAPRGQEDKELINILDVGLAVNEGARFWDLTSDYLYHRVWFYGQPENSPSQHRANGKLKLGLWQDILTTDVQGSLQQVDSVSAAPSYASQFYYSPQQQDVLSGSINPRFQMAMGETARIEVNSNYGQVNYLHESVRDGRSYGGDGKLSLRIFSGIRSSFDAKVNRAEMDSNVRVATGRATVSLMSEFSDALSIGGGAGADAQVIDMAAVSYHNRNVNYVLFVNGSWKPISSSILDFNYDLRSQTRNSFANFQYRASPWRLSISYDDTVRDSVSDLLSRMTQRIDTVTSNLQTSNLSSLYQYYRESGWRAGLDYNGRRTDLGIQGSIRIRESITTFENQDKTYNAVLNYGYRISHRVRATSRASYTRAGFASSRSRDYGFDVTLTRNLMRYADISLQYMRLDHKPISGEGGYKSNILFAQIGARF